jgi:hypothetical protein
MNIFSERGVQELSKNVLLKLFRPIYGELELETLSWLLRFYNKIS